MDKARDRLDDPEYKNCFRDGRMDALLGRAPGQKGARQRELTPTARAFKPASQSVRAALLDQAA